MADDREVLREVWQGRIPTAFTLCQDDLECLEQPDPFYLMLPRLSYISVVTEKVKKHFSKFLRSDNQAEAAAADMDMWFDFQGSPLKWHLPVGVLYDQISILNTDAEGPMLPPWNLTVHFGNFPQSEILKWDSKELFESYFMSCVKEADQIKHGGRVVSSMQKKDHNQLWQGLHNDKFDQFWAVNRRLMDTKGHAAAGGGGGGVAGGGGGDESFKHIPFRLYEADKPFQQRLIKPFVQTGSSSSQAEQAVGDKSDESNSPTEEATKRLATLKDLLETMLPDKSSSDVKVITQGISPELDTPLQWMSEHLSYPDNFLHICVR